MPLTWLAEGGGWLSLQGELAEQKGWLAAGGGGVTETGVGLAA